MATARAGKRAKSGENGRIDARPKTAALMRLESRWLRRDGPMVPKCHNRPERKIGDSRGLRIEITPVYVVKWL